MRKPVIAGNWKMYKTPKESLAFLDAFFPLVEGHERDEILVFPTMSSLGYVLEGTFGTNVKAGAQNMHWLNEGPYTGQTSPTMLVSIGCRHVLLGHSEQRLYFNETYERVNLKLKAAINHGITPIVCVGELLAEREDLRTEETLRNQVRAALRNISASEARRLVIAYEPIWAIGTGSTASPDCGCGGACNYPSGVEPLLRAADGGEDSNFVWWIGEAGEHRCADGAARYRRGASGRREPGADDVRGYCSLQG